MPDGAKLGILIRTTVVSLNHANQTGNYSVLRDLAAPEFQATNSPARLAEIFGPLRKRGLDLSPIVLFDPKLVQPPAINRDGRLRLTGFFDTRPERVVFDLLFQQVSGRWLLFGISLDTRPAQVPSASTSAGEQADGALTKKSKQPGKKATKKSKPKN